eukprot:g5034.t1
MSFEKEDPFWDAYDEEDRTVERGTEAGIKHAFYYVKLAISNELNSRHGKELGWVEGWELGVKQGYQLGLEIGFFSGSLDTLKFCQKKNPNLIPEKA